MEIYLFRIFTNTSKNMQLSNIWSCVLGSRWQKQQLRMKFFNKFDSNEKVLIIKTQAYQIECTNYIAQRHFDVVNEVNLIHVLQSFAIQIFKIFQQVFSPIINSNIFNVSRQKNVITKALKVLPQGSILSKNALVDLTASNFCLNKYINKHQKNHL